MVANILGYLLFRTSSSVDLVSHAVFWLYTIETDWLCWMWRKWNQVITSIRICNKWALFRSNRCIWFDLRGIRTIYFNECEVTYIEVSKGKLSWDVRKSRSQRWMQVEDSMLNLQLIAFFFSTTSGPEEVPATTSIVPASLSFGPSNILYPSSFLLLWL